MSQPGPKPGLNATARLERRVQVASLYCQGLAQSEIGAKLAISQSQVSRDLEWIHREWLKRAFQDRGAQVATELGKIDHLERAYWEGYERSRQPHEEQTAIRKERGTPGKQDADGKARAAEVEDKTGVRRYSRDGSASFLQGIQWCIDRRCRLLGLDAPARVDLEDEIRAMARENGYDPDEAVRIARQEARRLRAPSSIAAPFRKLRAADLDPGR